MSRISRVDRRTTPTPTSGTHAWWTSSADDLNTTLTRTLDLTGISKATVTANAWYDIEEGFDYLYAEYTGRRRPSWTARDPISGSTNGKWSNLRFTVPGNGKVEFRFRYQSDGGVHLAGAFIDDIVVKNGGTTLLTRQRRVRRERLDRRGRLQDQHRQRELDRRPYYLLENRTYVGYDATLAGGPVPVQQRPHGA